ncbi:MAG: hypothetical protein PUE17_01865 [Bacteroidales bacterium]|nr:hypothetical protein [Bacteroidales bacterium]
MQHKRPFAPPTDEGANFWQKYNLQTALEKNDLIFLGVSFVLLHLLRFKMQAFCVEFDG